MRDVMLDLETFNNTPDSVICAIGAVEFDPETGALGQTLYRVVDPQSCVELGMTIGVDTVKWWLQQGDEARAAITKDGGVPIKSALRDFASFIENMDCSAKHVRVWGNGAGFDNVILASAYRAADMSVPWQFYNDRCFRTLKALTPEVEYEKPSVAHHALEDAKAQALHAVKLLKLVGTE